MITISEVNDPLWKHDYFQDQWISKHPRLNSMCKEKVYVRLNLRKEGAVIWWRRRA